MSTFNQGDLVVLKSGSMRMIVEAINGEHVNCLWCHEGQIGRDTFPIFALNKWEYREDTGGYRGDRGGDRGDRGDRGGRPGSGKPYGGDRDGGGKPYGKGGGHRGGDRGGDRDRDRNTGWDGKPREKKYFRKDDD